MLQEWVDDKAFVALIEQWLKAGILDMNGEMIHSRGIVSPILANVYLHHVMDD